MIMKDSLVQLFQNRQNRVANRFKLFALKNVQNKEGIKTTIHQLSPAVKQRDKRQKEKGALIAVAFLNNVKRLLDNVDVVVKETVLPLLDNKHDSKKIINQHFLKVGVVEMISTSQQISFSFFYTQNK